MAENVIKDLGEIQARLLNHKPVIQGEIRLFVKEFEGKRNDREQKCLERIHRQVIELNEKIYPGCTNLMEKHLLEAKEQLEVTNMLCDRILQQEPKRTEGNPLGSERVKRDEEWKAFLEKLNHERDVLDSQHQRRIQSLEDRYAKLKQNLSSQT